MDGNRKNRTVTSSRWLAATRKLPWSLAGKFELSGEPCDSIHCTYAEFTQHIRELLEVAEPLDVVFLGLGMQPVSRLEEIEWVPKKRYRIMGPYMLKVGTLGQRMMKQTATVQANIDYRDEKDAMAKFRTGMGLTPIIIAMFANSPICDGQLNGYRSFREHIWTDTDKSRSGLLKFAFLPEVSFNHYVQYALDVPMYFIIRNHDYIDMTSMTFRQFLSVATTVSVQRSRIGMIISRLFPRDPDQAIHRGAFGR